MKKYLKIKFNYWVMLQLHWQQKYFLKKNQKKNLYSTNTHIGVIQ